MLGSVPVLFSGPGVVGYDVFNRNSPFISFMYVVVLFLGNVDVLHVGLSFSRKFISQLQKSPGERFSVSVCIFLSVPLCD